MEVARRAFAVFGPALAIGLALPFTASPAWGIGVIAAGVAGALAAAMATPKNGIRLEGDTLHYGASQRVSLAGLHKAGLAKKRHVGEVLVLDTGERRHFVPVDGVPRDVREALLDALRQRSE